MLRKKLTNRQYFFLQTIKRHPQGLHLDHWPETWVIRRWLKNPLFLEALASLRETLRFQTDLMLAGAATASAKLLCAMTSEKGTNRDYQQYDKWTSAYLKVVRAEHLRERETRPAGMMNPQIAMAVQARAAIAAEAAGGVTAAESGKQVESATPADGGKRRVSGSQRRQLLDVWKTLDRLIEGAANEHPALAGDVPTGKDDDAQSPPG